MPGVDNTF